MNAVEEHPLAVVTGVSSGIGAAVANHLLQQGWAVHGVSRRSPERAHPRLTWSQVDLARTRADEIAGLGSLEPTAIVHAAGLQRSAYLGHLDPAALAEMWAVHVDAPARLVDALVGRLRDGGRIVLIGSRTSSGVAGKSQYAATKAALTGLTRSWAKELAPRQVTVNVVAPGPTETPMLADPARAATPVQLPPLGRLVQPDEVAALVGFLLGPGGRSITGQRLVVCAGASL